MQAASTSQITAKGTSSTVICNTSIFLFIDLAPLEKLISSDKLTFIPNLYYQQYRLLDLLEECRSDYPDQKILVRKAQSTHEFLLREMRQNHFILQEEIKYRKVVSFHIAKCAKDQYFKKKLKKEEKFLFHRVAFSQLAEAVKNKFDENKSDVRVQAKKDQQKKINKPKITDDIFMDKEESLNMEGGDDDLLGDIFANDKAEPPAEKQEVAPLPTIQDYINKQIQDQRHLKQIKKVLNRKGCLKKINENIRKRIKSKLNQDSGEKNLNSATVLITSLISNQTDPKQPESNNEVLLIDPPAETQFLSHVEARPKKKKDENFELKWNKQTMKEFEQKNSKFEINKSKFQSNYLTTSIVKDDKQFEKVFNKNIAGKEPFPPSINSIPKVEEMFKINPYFNTPADRDYEQFVIRHNKRVKYEKFKQIASYALADTYIPENNEVSNVAKIFLNPEGTLSDRVIYKINSNKLVPINAVYQKSNLTKEQLYLLNFLVRRYLCIFGNNWKVITTLILTHPNFSNMYLSTEQIQELFQIVKDKDNVSSLSQISMMNKKVLPSSIFVNSSYEEVNNNCGLQSVMEEMTDESEDSNQHAPQIDFETINSKSYQDLLEEELAEHQNPKQYVFANTAKMFDQYSKNVKLPPLNEPSIYLGESLSHVIMEFQNKGQIKYVDHKEPSKINQCSDWVLEKVKNQIKFSSAIRKRKNITDKSSELVKILHSLKQKLQNPPRAAVPPNRIAPTSSQPAQLAKPAVTPAATVTATPPPTPTETASIIKKTLPKPTKPDEKKAAQKEQKQPKDQKEKKKKPGKDEKDQQKDDVSK